jgi:hypothetical protein
MRLVANATNTLRLRVARAPVERRTPQPDPHRALHGIALGVLLGTVLWAVIIAIGVAAYGWLGY